MHRVMKGWDFAGKTISTRNIKSWWCLLLITESGHMHSLDTHIPVWAFPAEIWDNSTSVSPYLSMSSCATGDSALLNVYNNKTGIRRVSWDSFRSWWKSLSFLLTRFSHFLCIKIIFLPFLLKVTLTINHGIWMGLLSLSWSLLALFLFQGKVQAPPERKNHPLGMHLSLHGLPKVSWWDE